MRMLEKQPEDRWQTLDDVVAVCGRPSLRRDDPVRSEMMTLAKPGRQAQLLADMPVPTSPVALAKSHMHPAVQARRRVSRIWWGIGAVAVTRRWRGLWCRTLCRGVHCAEQGRRPRSGGRYRLDAEAAGHRVRHARRARRGATRASREPGGNRCTTAAPGPAPRADSVRYRDGASKRTAC
jgi:hypothetical protein